MGLDLDDDVLRELGRVTTAGARLDLQAASVLVILTGDHDLDATYSLPAGKVRTMIRSAAETLECAALQQDVLAWLDDATALAEERNRTVHSIAIHNYDDGNAVIRNYHPKTGTEQILTASELFQLALRISGKAAAVPAGLQDRLITAIARSETDAD